MHSIAIRPLSVQGSGPGSFLLSMDLLEQLLQGVEDTGIPGHEGHGMPMDYLAAKNAAAAPASSISRLPAQ